MPKNLILMYDACRKWVVKNYVDRKLKGKDVAPMLSYDAEIQKEMESVLDEE